MSAQFPFLGVGMSASIPEAVDIAKERLAGSNWYPVDFLNVGVVSESHIPEGMRTLMGDVGYPLVGHLEEVDFVGLPDEDRMRVLADRAERLGCEWVESDLGVWTWNGARLGSRMIPPALDRASLDESCRILERVLEIFPCPMLVENPPFYAVHGDELDILQYLLELRRRTGCGLLIDIGHLIGFCVLTHRDPMEYLRAWPCSEGVMELHLAGYDLQETEGGIYWVDAHERDIAPLALAMLDLALQKFSDVKAITLEVESAPPAVIQCSIAAVRRIVEVEEVRDVF